MENNEMYSEEERLPITSSDAMEQAIREVEQQEQLYSIAHYLFSLRNIKIGPNRLIEPR